MSISRRPLTGPRSLGRVAGAVAAAVAALGSTAVLPAAAADSPTPRIVGGHPTGRTYPGMMSLQFEARDGRIMHGCGATLIDPQWAVTAAHCIDPSNTQLRIGSTRWDSGGTTVKIVKQVPHPDWNGSADIALVKLARPLGYRPAQLAKPDPTKPLPVRLVGWGAFTADGDSPKFLQAVDSFVLRPRECEGMGVGDLCVDDLNDPATSACYGDSGGPAYVRQDGQWRLLGATSRWGGSHGAPCAGSTVYTSVPYFRSWIETTIGRRLP